MKNKVIKFLSVFILTTMCFLNVAPVVEAKNVLGLKSYSEKPEITSPDDGDEVPYDDIRIRWRSNSNSDEYIITIKDITDDDYITNREVVDSTRYTIDKRDIEPGHEYKIAVAAPTEDGRENWVEDPVYITVEDIVLERPEIISPYDGDEYEKEDIRVRWTSVDGADYYRYSVRDVTEDDRIIDEETNRTKCTIDESDLKEGHEYKIAVGAYTDDGENKWVEDPVYITIKQKPIIKPEITSPNNNEEVSYDDISIRWRSESESGKHILSIKDTTDNYYLEERKEIWDTSYTIYKSDLQPEHKYKISVAAPVEDGRENWAQDPVYFTVQNIPEPVKPVITVPSNGDKLPNSEDIKITWRSESESGRHIITIKDVTDDYYLEELKKIQDTSYVIDKSNIKPGHEYKIAVAAPVEDGRKNWAQDPVYFTVENIPEPEPVIEEIDISDDDITLEIDERHQLNADTYPEDVTRKKLEWTSDSPSIVKVDRNTGEITALREGEATVKVSEIYSGISESCTVTVTKEPVKLVITSPNNGDELPNNKDIKITWRIESESGRNIRYQQSIFFITIEDVTEDYYLENFKEIQDRSYIIDKSDIKPRHEYKISVKIPMDDGRGNWVEDYVYFTVEGIPEPVIEEIEISDDEINLQVGEDYELSAYTYPEDITRKKLEWTSSNPSIVRVDRNTGEITALREGKATIKVRERYSGISESCTVTVKKEPVIEEIEISDDDITLDVGEDYQLNAYTYPEDITRKKLEWTSSNSSIVRVDKNTGEITGVREGKTTVKVRERYSGVNKRCTVTVNEVPIDPPKIVIFEKEIKVKLGEKVNLSGYIKSIDKLTKVSLCVKDWHDNSEGKYATRYLSSKNVKEFNLNEFVIDTTKAPFNQVKEHEVNIWAKTSSYSNPKKALGEIKVIVEEEPVVTEVELSESRLILKEGDSYDLDVKVSPENISNKKLQWSSSKNYVVKVDRNTGKITALREGKAVIKVREKYSEITDSCTVTVEKIPAKQPQINIFQKTIKVKLGDKTNLKGYIFSEDKLTKVSLCVKDWYEKPQGTYDTKYLSGQNVTVFGLNEFIIDTTKAPFDKAGEYEVNIWAKTSKYNNPKKELGKIKVIVEKKVTKPIIISPVDGNEVSYDDIVIRWRSESKSNKYLITIKDIKDNKYIVERKKINNTSYKLLKSDIEPGHKYKIAVAAPTETQGENWVQNPVYITVKQDNKDEVVVKEFEVPSEIMKGKGLPISLRIEANSKITEVAFGVVGYNEKDFNGNKYAGIIFAKSPNEKTFKMNNFTIDNKYLHEAFKEPGKYTVHLWIKTENLDDSQIMKVFNVNVCEFRISIPNFEKTIQHHFQYKLRKIPLNTDFAKKAVWTSSNSDVAYFSSKQKGLIIAKSPGKTIITAKIPGYSLVKTELVVSKKEIKPEKKSDKECLEDFMSIDSKTYIVEGKEYHQMKNKVDINLEGKYYQSGTLRCYIDDKGKIVSDGAVIYKLETINRAIIMKELDFFKEESVKQEIKYCNMMNSEVKKIIERDAALDKIISGMTKIGLSAYSKIDVKKLIVNKKVNKEIYEKVKKEIQNEFWANVITLLISESKQNSMKQNNIKASIKIAVDHPNEIAGWFHMYQAKANFNQLLHFNKNVYIYDNAQELIDIYDNANADEYIAMALYKPLLNKDQANIWERINDAFRESSIDVLGEVPGLNYYVKTVTNCCLVKSYVELPKLIEGYKADANEYSMKMGIVNNAIEIRDTYVYGLNNKKNSIELLNNKK